MKVKDVNFLQILTKNCYNLRSGNSQLPFPDIILKIRVELMPMAFKKGNRLLSRLRLNLLSFFCRKDARF